MDVITINGASMVRFVTTTRGWAERAPNNMYVPDKWSCMIVELLVSNSGTILMSSALGIPRSSVTSLKHQGLHYYTFDELPLPLVNAITSHFVSSYKALLKRANSLVSAPSKPRLTLIKRHSS